MKAPYWGSLVGQALWNVCVIAEKAVPGIVTVQAKKGRDVEVKKSKGNNNATSTDNGAANGTVTIETVIYNESQWLLWQEFLPTIDPNRPGATSQPLGIIHPETQARGITSIFVTDIVGEPPTGRGGKRFTISCIEYAPKPKPPKKKSSIKQAKVDVKREGKSAPKGATIGKTQITNEDWAARSVGKTFI